MTSSRLTLLVVVGFLSGLALGYAVHLLASQGTANGFADAMELLPFAFLRLIRMVVAPLVLATLVLGVAKMEDVASVGRIGGKALGWFICASLLSLLLGLLLVQAFAPGKFLHLAPPAVTTTSAIAAGGMSLRGIIEHTLPASIADAMARNEILQIVVFSLFFGTAMAAVGAASRGLFDAFQGLSQVMLKVTGYVMTLAPVAVFGAMASTVAREGVAILGAYGLFVGEFYLGLVLLWLTLITLGMWVAGRRILRLVRDVRESVLLAFSTSSSEAAYPGTLEALERFGCSNRVASFVLPLGYSFNLDGSMMYCSFAVLFVAQVYGVTLGFSKELLLVALLMLTSKGIAGVPRASLVVVAATLPQLGIPEAGLLLLVGIDHFLDMGRSATNVLGNSIAAVLVSKWEGELI